MYTYISDIRGLEFLGMVSIWDVHRNKGESMTGERLGPKVSTAQSHQLCRDVATKALSWKGRPLSMAEGAAEYLGHCPPGNVTDLYSTKDKAGPNWPTIS